MQMARRASETAGGDAGTRSRSSRRRHTADSPGWRSPATRNVEAPVLGPRGVPVHRRGVTAAPGLYFLGLSWLHTRGSALLGWVGHDAEHLAAVVEHGLAGSAAEEDGA